MTEATVELDDQVVGNVLDVAVVDRSAVRRADLPHGSGQPMCSLDSGQIGLLEVGLNAGCGVRQDLQQHGTTAEPRELVQFGQ